MTGALQRALDSQTPDNRAQIAALLPAVYTELREIALRLMLRERPDHPLQATALVHEAYLRLLRGAPLGKLDQLQLKRLATHVMRHVLIDISRPPQQPNGPLPTTLLVRGSTAPIDALALSDALDQLSLHYPDAAQVAELHVFGGHDFAEIRAMLALNNNQTEEAWRFAKAVLKRLLFADRN